MRWALIPAAVLAALLAWTLPAVAAAICPICYGLERLDDHIYSDAPSAQITAQINAARAQVATVWGELRAEPVFLVCQSAECDARLGGRGAKGMSYGPWVIHLSEPSQTIAAHELAHAELHARIGAVAQWRGDVPAWLNEGLAVLISQDARYLNRPQDCLSPAHLPQNARDWRRHGDWDRLYTQAACAAQDWISGRGGLQNLGQLFPSP